MASTLTISWAAVALVWGFLAALFGFIWIVNKNSQDSFFKLQKELSEFKERVARIYFEKNDAQKLQQNFDARVTLLESRIYNWLSGKVKKDGM